MKSELQLKIQAYLDGELSAWQSRRMARLVATDPEAQKLLSELRTTRDFLAANEPERLLPEEPRFYWSRIQQSIERCDALAEPIRTEGFSWRRMLAPLAGVAMAALLAVVSVKFLPSTTNEDSLWNLAEIENLSADTDFKSFRSTSEKMFVVWIEEKPVATEPESDYFEDDDLLF